MVDDIMEKLPDPFNMAEIMGKVEERTPYVIVAFQVSSASRLAHNFRQQFSLRGRSRDLGFESRLDISISISLFQCPCMGTSLLISLKKRCQAVQLVAAQV